MQEEDASLKEKWQTVYGNPRRKTTNNTPTGLLLRDAQPHHVMQALVMAAGLTPAEFRCYPYRPKAQFCSRCHLLGHRADVCASPPDTILCAQCSTPLNSTDEPHDCHVRCKTCSGDHPTTSTQCPARLQANAQAVKQAYERRIQLRKTTAQDLTKQKPPPARQHRPRSRSRAPVRRPTTPRPKTPSKQPQSRNSSSRQQVSQPLPPLSPSPDNMSDSTTPSPHQHLTATHKHPHHCVPRNPRRHPHNP
ncbi:hypothetical protein ISCGN_007298 [Ixodes scapularis]